MTGERERAVASRFSYSKSLIRLDLDVLSASHHDGMLASCTYKAVREQETKRHPAIQSSKHAKSVDLD